jgi:hypothetical protein
MGGIMKSMRIVALAQVLALYATPKPVVDKISKILADAAK